MYQLVHGKRQIGVYPFFSTEIWLKNDPRHSLREISLLGVEGWRPLMYLGIPFTFRENGASLLLLTYKGIRAMSKEKIEEWLRRGVVADGSAALEVERILMRKLSGDDKISVFCKDKDKRWNNDVWGLEASLRIKDSMDMLCGGRMPSRVDTAVRMAQSTWDSIDGKERAVFLFNMDFDDSTDARLTVDGNYRAEVLDVASGVFIPVGEGDSFRLPTIPAWSPLAVRLVKIN